MVLNCCTYLARATQQLCVCVHIASAVSWRAQTSPGAQKFASSSFIDSLAPGRRTRPAKVPFDACERRLGWAIRRGVQWRATTMASGPLHSGFITATERCSNLWGSTRPADSGTELCVVGMATSPNARCPGHCQCFSQTLTEAFTKLSFSFSCSDEK